MVVCANSKHHSKEIENKNKNKNKSSLKKQQQISHSLLPALRVEVMANSEHISLSIFCVLPPAYRGTALWITPGFEPSSIRAQEGVVNSLSRPPTAPSPRLRLKEGGHVRYYTDRATGLLMLCSKLLASAKTPNLAAAWRFAESRPYQYGLSWNGAEHIYQDGCSGKEEIKGVRGNENSKVKDDEERD